LCSGAGVASKPLAADVVAGLAACSCTGAATGKSALKWFVFSPVLGALIGGGGGGMSRGNSHGGNSSGAGVRGKADAGEGADNKPSNGNGAGVRKKQPGGVLVGAESGARGA